MPPQLPASTFNTAGALTVSAGRPRQLQDKQRTSDNPLSYAWKAREGRSQRGPGALGGGPPPARLPPRALNRHARLQPAAATAGSLTGSASVRALRRGVRPEALQSDLLRRGLPPGQSPIAATVSVLVASAHKCCLLSRVCVARVCGACVWRVRVWRVCVTKCRLGLGRLRSRTGRRTARWPGTPALRAIACATNARREEVMCV